MPSPTTQTAGPPAPEPLAADPVSHWLLDPEIDFLNHGCFGAAPRVVLDAQHTWRQRLETSPIELLHRRRRELLVEPKAAIGRFLGMAPDDFGFVTNATGGVNAVLRSLPFGQGDEIVTTDHVYHAVRQTLRHVTEAAGGRFHEVPIPLPVRRPDDVAGPIEAALNDRTKLVLIDHVTSPTAIVVPVEQILATCAARGVDVLVDAAHAPGMLPLSVEGLGAAYYTGNLHKWVCAPKGAAFLYVRRDRQEGIHPNTISHFLGEGLAEEFQWQGTRDITPWLCAREAIEFMQAQFGWDAVRRHNHELAVWVQDHLSRRWGVEPCTPRDGSMLGSMVTLPLPGNPRERFATFEAMEIHLYREHRIEVPIIEWSDRWWIRASCQVYNRPAQYERLGDVIAEVVGG